MLVDQAEREAIVRKGALIAAEDAGFNLVEDEGLVVENAGLTEWPVPLLGNFDADYLDVPPEVIQLTARTNQKYFVMRDGAGRLAPNFVCVANIDANDGGAAIVAGNERVLAARLSDARFFWQQDVKVPLEEQAKKLEQIVFHEKLGTVADKVDRVAKLARWLVEEGIVKPSPLWGGKGGGPAASAADKTQSLSAADAAGPPPRSSPTRGEEVAALADQAERAARLAKADLVTGMVGEFPELQGVIGGYLARAQGEDDAVADAVRDHYKPVGQGDDVPTAPVTVAVSLADKLDTLCSFFEIKEFPTGSRDPFALRRAAIGIITIIQNAKLKLHITQVIRLGWLGLSDQRKILSDQDFSRLAVADSVTEFIADRLEVALKAVGISHDLVRASKTWGTATDGRLDRIEARAFALHELIGSQQGTNLLAGYKRAANILKKEEGSWFPDQFRSDVATEGVEAALIAALDSAEPTATAAVAAEDFTAAMTAVATLRAPIDAFFEGVMINDPDPATRAFRLGLLARFRDAVHAVADFSKIEG